MHTSQCIYKYIYIYIIYLLCYNTLINIKIAASFTANHFIYFLQYTEIITGIIIY